MTRSLIAILVIVVSLLNNAAWHSAIINHACFAIAMAVVATLLVQRDREASS